jgi:hypothetical protein
MIALREATAWFGVFAYNEFSMQAMLMAPPPWELQPANWNARPVTPHDDLLITEWLQKEDITVNPVIAAQAIEAVAHERSFHPVLEYLDSLEWDGVPRLKSLLPSEPGASLSTEAGRKYRAPKIRTVRQFGRTFPFGQFRWTKSTCGYLPLMQWQTRLQRFKENGLRSVTYFYAWSTCGTTIGSHSGGVRVLQRLSH